MLKLKDIAKALDIPCDQDIDITGLNTLGDAGRSEISFLENSKYLKHLSNTKAGAVLVHPNNKDDVPEGVIPLVTETPYLKLAYASKLFAPRVVETEGKDPVIGKDTIVMPNAYVGRNAVIGDNCVIMSGCFVGDNVTIGNNTILHANVSVYRDCKIGDDCIIHAGTVIGSDGFGFAHTKDGKYIKIYQNGNVTIGNDVEIGANTCIDRAAFKSTEIHDGVRLDNLVHIAHNCIIGKGTILTGQVGLAGSSILKEYVVMGAQGGVAGHLEVAPFTTIAARGAVTKTIKEPGKSWAGFPLMEHRTWLKLQGKIAKLLKQ